MIKHIVVAKGAAVQCLSYADAKPEVPEGFTEMSEVRPSPAHIEVGGRWALDKNLIATKLDELQARKIDEIRREASNRIERGFKLGDQRVTCTPTDQLNLMHEIAGADGANLGKLQETQRAMWQHILANRKAAEGKREAVYAARLKGSIEALEAIDVAGGWPS